MVEDQIVSDDRFELIEKFFEINGSRKLMFYYQVRPSIILHSLSNLSIFPLQEAVPRESAYSRAEVASVIPHTSAKKLFLTNGDSEGIGGVMRHARGFPTKRHVVSALTGVCYFFVRTTTKSITSANIANEVNFGMIDSTGSIDSLGLIDSLIDNLPL